MLSARFLARRAAAALRNLPEFVPPREFPCRIERLPEGCSTIDNELYDDAHYSSTWHAEDTSRELATLQLLNAARIPYFDRVWRLQLQLPPTRPGNFLEVGCGGGVATDHACSGIWLHYVRVTWGVCTTTTSTTSSSTSSIDRNFGSLRMSSGMVET